MTGRLSELLDSARAHESAMHDVPAERAGQATASITSGPGSVNYAVGAFHRVTIIGSKVGWMVVDERAIRKIRSDHYYVQASQSRDEFKKAESSLDFHGITVIEGERGTGRRTDAIRLLSATTPPGTPIYELLPDWDDDHADLSMLPRERGFSFLLDLTIESQEISQTFAHDLLAYGQNLKRLNSQIAVLVTPSLWARCRPIMVNQTVTLLPREPEQIIKAHITFRDSSLKALPWLNEEPLHGLILRMRERRASPGEAVRLAESLIDTTVDKLQMIVEAHARWKEYIDKQLDSRQQNSAGRRILLIALAVLNDSPSVAVDEASRKLAASLGHDKVALYLALETEGWSTRLSEIEASVTDDRTHLDRRKQGLDLAIVEWLWRERPELRRAFLDWIGLLALDPLTSKHANRLVHVLVHLVRSFQSAEILEKLHSWIKGGRKSQSECRRLAEGALAALLVDDSAGGLTRRYLWQWAYRGPTAAFSSLALLCGGTFGQTYPQVALARLRHLATRANEADAKLAAGSAIRAMVKSEDLRFMVVEKILEWSCDPASERAGMVGLTALLDPRPEDSVVGSLIQHASSDERMLRSLREAWVTLIQKQDQNEVDAITRQWSLGRDENRFDAATCDRLMVSVMEEVLAQEPRTAFLRAMTDHTRSQMLMHAVGQNPTTRTQQYERHPLPLELSPQVGAGESPPVEIPETV